MSASLRRFAPLLLLVLPLGCAHGIRVSSSDENWISPGNAYVGATDRKNSVGEGLPVELRFRGTAGQQVGFRFETRKGEAASGGLKLLRASGEEVEARKESQEARDLQVVSALLPGTEDYLLQVFTGDLYFGTFADFRLEFLPNTSPPVLELQPGAPLTAELSATDRRDLADGAVDLYRLPVGKDPTRYTFLAKSSAFSPSVWVYTDGLGKRPENHYGADEFTDTVKGEVFVAVTARLEDHRLGPYTLEVRDARAWELATFPTLELGARHEGKLELRGPNSSAHFKVRGVPGVAYVIDARSADFDVALLLTNNQPRFHPKFLGVMDDDGAGGTNARLRFKFPDREEWVLKVLSNGNDASGAYALQFNTEDKAPPIDPAETAHMLKGVRRPVRELQKGVPVTARLEAGTGAPKYAGRDVYMFHGAENDAVTLTLDARDFDGVLSVTQVGAREPVGAVTARRGSPAKLELKLPAPARADYFIQVEPLDGKSRGSYALELK